MFQVPQVPEGQEGTKDIRGHLVSLAKKERKGKRVVQGYKDPKERKVYQDYRVLQGWEVYQANLATLGPRAPGGQEAGLVLPEVKASQVLPLCLEEMDSLAHRGHRAHQVSEAQWDQLGSKG